MTRILLCTSGGLYGALVLDRLLRTPTVELVGVVQSTRVMHPAYGWLRGAAAQFGRSGLRYTLYLGCVATLPELLGRWTTPASVAVSARQRHIPLHATRDLNDADGIHFVEALGADLLVSAFFNQRIGEAVCKLPTLGAVNIHPSRLPAFRGVDPVFHSRLRGATEYGVTLHRIADTFDTGPVLADASVGIRDGQSVVSATASLFAHGAALLVDALPAIERGEPGRPQAPGGDYDSWPTSSEVAGLLKRGHRLVAFADWRLLGVGSSGRVDAAR